MIGGNTVATLQTRASTTANEIGERIATWSDAVTLTGWLDLMSGDSRHATYSTKLQESTHVFVGDYVDLSGIAAENSRLVHAGNVYEVTYIDDPMGLHRQIEIYLNFIGGQ